MQPQKVSFDGAVKRSGWSEPIVFVDFAVAEDSPIWPSKADRPASTVAVYASTACFQHKSDDRPEKCDLQIC
jgi:hypothetical protein